MSQPLSEPLVTIYDYLERIGGSEKYEFWQMENGKIVFDNKGHTFPDPDAAYDFCKKLREQHPDLKITHSTNVVRVSLPVQVLTT